MGYSQPLNFDGKRSQSRPSKSETCGNRRRRDPSCLGSGVAAPRRVVAATAPQSVTSSPRGLAATRLRRSRAVTSSPRRRRDPIAS